MESVPSSLLPTVHSTNPPYMLRQALPEPCLDTVNNISYSEHNTSVKSFIKLTTYCKIISVYNQNRKYLFIDVLTSDLHIKDKIGDEEELKVIYKIPSKNCYHAYIRETG